jgi:hypothetical protein
MGCACTRGTKTVSVVITSENRKEETRGNIVKADELKSHNSVVTRPHKPQQVNSIPTSKISPSIPESRSDSHRNPNATILKPHKPQHLSSRAQLHTSNQTLETPKITLNSTQIKSSESRLSISPKESPKLSQESNPPPDKIPKCLNGHKLHTSSSSTKWLCSYCAKTDLKPPSTCAECGFFLCSICVSWVSGYLTGTVEHASCPLISNLLSYYGYNMILKSSSCKSCICKHSKTHAENIVSDN